MTRKELETQIKDIISRYTYVIVTLDSNIHDDLGVDSVDEAAIEMDITEELNVKIHWSESERFWRTKPTVAELCDFIEREL